MKKIAVYGTYSAKEPSWQRYWIKRKDGVRQRYWKKPKRLKKVTSDGRYEFHGSGKDLYKAVVKAHRYMPRGFVDIAALDFLDHPEDFGLEGSWIAKDIRS